MTATGPPSAVGDTLTDTAGDTVGEAAAGPAGGGAHGDFRFDPYRPGFHLDPCPHYDALRAADPVHRSALGVWVVSPCQQAGEVLRDPRFSSDLRHWPGYGRRYGRDGTLSWLLEHWALNLDAPVHTRLRRHLGKAFGSALEGCGDEVRRVVDRLVDRVLARGDREMEVVADLARPLPLHVIATLFGIPEHDRPRVKDWSREIATLIEPAPSLERLETIRVCVEEFAAYLRALFQSPGRAPFLDGFLQAVADDDSLEEDHAVANSILLFSAGHESTANLLSAGLLALLGAPGAMARLRADPGLIPAAVEEMLRCTSPLQMLWRTATTELQVGERTIAPGEHVMVLLAAANRDPAQFDRPERFDLSRARNPHLAFGGGPHSCFGAGLARLEAQTVLSVLLERMPELSLTDRPPVWKTTLGMRGLESLVVRF